MQFSFATAVAVTVTDVAARATLFVVAAVLTRNGPSPPSTELFVALYLVQWQYLCLRHIFLCLDRLERGSPWLHGR